MKFFFRDLTHLLVLSFFLSTQMIFSQKTPQIIVDKKISNTNYLPDFSYAGYHNGGKKIPFKKENIVLATDYGVVANDSLDDSKAIRKAIEACNDIDNVVLQLPKGRLILSEILFINRSNFVLRGTGSGVEGTEIFCPRPMMYLKDPNQLKELREYLIKLNKRQVEPENNIDLPFSQYAWSGGMIWTDVPGERVKYYLANYDVPKKIVTKVLNGKRGEHVLTVANTKNIKKGDVVQLELFNKQGKEGNIIKDLYKNTTVKVGSHHWNYPDLPLVTQQVEIIQIKENKVTINAPLTISIEAEYEAQLKEWKHLKEVGIEHLKITFPNSPYVAHHVEQGYNAIFLTRLYDSWVNDVVIENADSGILTEEIANVTINDITTRGQHKAHYTVAMGGVHNVLASNVKVYNNAMHPLSFNTFSTKNVYKDCEVFVAPILDQHSGVNHQNLFDNIKVHVQVEKDNSYPLFMGGGAGYWKPSHGAFSTFWNIEVQFLNGFETNNPIILDGMKDGPYARLIGIHGNKEIKIDYNPKSYIEMTNSSIQQIPSLYDYQLQKRLANALVK